MNIRHVAFVALALAAGPVHAEITFYHADPLGSTRLVTDQTGEVVSRHDYLPFGEEIPAQLGRGSMGGYGATDELRRFTDKERDAESGLDCFGARYYSAHHARFTSVDPVISEGNITVPQRWNRYVYVLNNPLRYVDPDGNSEVNALVGEAGEIVAQKALRADGWTIVLDAARKPVTANGFDFVAVKGFEVIVVDNKAVRRNSISSATSLVGKTLRKNIHMAQAELIHRLAQGGLSEAEEKAVRTALRSLQKRGFQLMITTAGGTATRVSARLAARGIGLFRILGIAAAGIGLETVMLVGDATAANEGATFADEEEKKEAYVYGRFTVMESGQDLSQAEIDYLKRVYGEVEEP